MIETDGEVLQIPATTTSRFISGIVALNIISDDGTGDWHSWQTFHQPHRRRPRSFLVGIGQGNNTVPLLGDKGVYDCSAILDRMRVPHPPGPVYAATHARAIADLVLGAVLLGNKPTFIVLDEWMPRQRNKNEVWELLADAEPRIPAHAHDLLRAWISQNIDQT